MVIKVEVNLKVNKSELSKVLDKIIEMVAEDIFNNAQMNIFDFEIYDTGALYNSARKEKGKHRRILSWDTVYASDVEFGSHSLEGSKIDPTYEVILDWVKRNIGKKSFLKSDLPPNVVAMKIYKKIKEEGTTPRAFVREAIEKTRQKCLM